MDRDFFDYDELNRNVDDLLEEEYGPVQGEDFSYLPEPEAPFRIRNAANGYGEQEYGAASQLPSYDEEAAAMKYDPQTNAGAVIRAYNTDYASRNVRKARKVREPSEPAQERYEHEPRPKKPSQKHKKKHIFLKFLLVLLLLAVLSVAALWVFAKQPAAADAGARKDGCTAILLAGTDADGVRTDTMMLLYLDEKNREMNLLSIPRDTYTQMDISVPKLNAVYGVAGGGKKGMERLLDYTESCIGYRPDGYVLVNLDSFSSLVDVMGGVRFDVPCDMEYEDPSQDLHIKLKAGEQHLNGKEAMWAVRFRSGYALADLKRVEVQRDFIKAALSQWLQVKNVWRAPAAATLVTTNTTTNLSLREIAWLAKAAKYIGTDNMHTETLPGEAAYVGGGSFYILWPETTAKLVNEYYNPYEQDVSASSIYSPYY